MYTWNEADAGTHNLVLVQLEGMICTTPYYKLNATYTRGRKTCFTIQSYNVGSVGGC